MKAVIAITLAALAMPCLSYAQSASGPTGAARQPPAGALQLSAEQFAHKAASGNLAEVALGRMTAEKAKRDDVKQFGQRMVQDHSRANEELQAVAQRKGITLPTEPETAEQDKAKELSQLSGEEFDRQYSRHMVEDHRKDVSMYQTMVQTGEDQDIKAYAQKTLPILEEHLRMAQAMAEEMAAAPEQPAPQAR